MGGNLLTVQSLTHTHSNDDIFHGSDKMPKHVEMVWTKCQPKIGTDKMPTTIKSPDKMPTKGPVAFCLHTESIYSSSRQRRHKGQLCTTKKLIY